MVERCVRRCLGVVLLLAAGAGLAAGPVDLYDFQDAEQEARFRDLIAELRCPKCLNTNLAGSDAPIAQDLRRTVHRLLTEEQMSDAEVLAFLQARYGDFVLYNPPFRPDTWVLWLGPLAFVAVGVVVLWRVLRQPPQAPLSAEETERVRTILGRR
ncbi:MAG: cytochrome c-type biogenesis protein CcmH [Pseudomonadales bacterium]